MGGFCGQHYHHNQTCSECVSTMEERNETESDETTERPVVGNLAETHEKMSEV